MAADHRSLAAGRRRAAVPQGRASPSRRGGARRGGRRPDRGTPVACPGPTPGERACRGPRDDGRGQSPSTRHRPQAPRGRGRVGPRGWREQARAPCVPLEQPAIRLYEASASSAGTPPQALPPRRRPRGRAPHGLSPPSARDSLHLQRPDREASHLGAHGAGRAPRHHHPARRPDGLDELGDRRPRLRPADREATQLGALLENGRGIERGVGRSSRRSHARRPCGNVQARVSRVCADFVPGL